MDILRIQDLITEGRIVELADINPTESYIQLGVYQKGNRRSDSGNADAYKSYVIPVSELIGGPPPPVITDMKNYILVDQQYGNDSTAVRNNDLLPFQSINAAILASQDGDTIIMNPGSSYYSSVNIMPWSLKYYLRPGATWYIQTMDNALPGIELQILGHGDLIFLGVPGVTGNHDRDITIECNTIQLGQYWFLNNGPYLSGATTPLTLKIKAKKAFAFGVIGILYSLPWQLQIDYDYYESTVFFAGADFWCIQDFQNIALPAVKTKNVININRAIITRNGVPFMTLVAGRNANETYVNANINYTNAVAGAAPFILRFDGGGDPLACRQTVFFDGVFNIINGSMFYDQAGLSGGEQGRLQIKGKVYHQDDTATILYTPIYAAAGTKVEIRADIISSSANNNIISVGGTRSEVDIRNAKIINTDGTGLAPANIFKAGGINVPLRLDDVKLLSQGSNTILGAVPGEPVQVYSAYSNAGTTNITNTLIGTSIIVDPAITDNNF